MRWRELASVRDTVHGLFSPLGGGRQHNILDDHAFSAPAHLFNQEGQAEEAPTTGLSTYWLRTHTSTTSHCGTCAQNSAAADYR